tara:strand:+ start:783 stop:1106 length:324 start_codon:yes stop_codon:yes gene_type:complete
MKGEKFMARKKVVSNGTRKEPLEIIQQALTIHQREVDAKANRALKVAQVIGMLNEEFEKILEHVEAGKPVQPKQTKTVIEIVSVLKKAGIMVIDAHVVMKQLREGRK